MNKLAMLYNNKISLNPAIFDFELLKKAGIYQLNDFLIKCKVLLNQLCNDIKNDSLQEKEFYTHMMDKKIT